MPTYDRGQSIKAQRASEQALINGADSLMDRVMRLHASIARARQRHDTDWVGDLTDMVTRRELLLTAEERDRIWLQAKRGEIVGKFTFAAVKRDDEQEPAKSDYVSQAFSR